MTTEHIGITPAHDCVPHTPGRDLEWLLDTYGGWIVALAAAALVAFWLFIG